MNAISHGQGSGRGAGALKALLDRASPTSLRWFAGLLGAFQGSVLLVVPHRMQSVAYETLQPYLAAWGLAFLVSGCLMLVVTSSRISQRWVLLPHLPLALSFLGLAAALARSEVWTAVVTTGLLGLGVAAAALLPPRGRQQPVPGDLFALLMAATGVVGGLLLAAGLVLLDHPIYRLSQPVLPILGITWLVVGILLWRVQTSPVNQPAWLRSVHAAAGLQMLLLGLVVALPSRAWFGAAYYLGGGLTLALLPWLRRRLSGFDALSLRTRLALTLALVASASLTLTVALMSHQQEQQARRNVQRTLEQRAELMAAADLLVLSSRVEGIPGVLLEAAARGVPAVSTHVGAVSEALSDGRTGLLVPPGDPAALGAAIGRLLDDPDERRALGAAARERVRRDFDLERITDRFFDLYRELGVGLA